MHRVTRRYVYRGVGLRHHRRALVCRVGIQKPTVEESRALSEVVTARIRAEFQNADAGRARSARLPARCFTGIRPFHYSANIKSPVEDAVFPRRRPLGAQAAKLTAVVQNGGRLGRSMV